MKSSVSIRPARRDQWLKILPLVSCFAIVGIFGAAPSAAAEPSGAAGLRAEFADPPAEARPWVLWYWCGQYISEEGITADLEAFRDAGISGVHIVNVGRLIKQGPVRLYSPEWMRLMRHAIATAGRLGIAVNLYNGPGWSSSGGPWITPEMSMKKLTWSETRVAGGKQVEVQLPRPPVIDSVFSVPSEPPIDTDWYRDELVIAFPTPERERSIPQPVVSSDDPGFDPSLFNSMPEALAGAAFTFGALAQSSADRPMRQHRFESRWGHHPISFKVSDCADPKISFQPLIPMSGTDGHR